MSFFLPNKLNPQGQRLLTIIIALPVFVSTSYILYKRVVSEEAVRKPMIRSQDPSPNDIFAEYERDMERQRKEASTSSSTSTPTA
ncbi:hypothetical protein BG006_008357 [Podila minutissima]|uniref:Uncharacterized protein n=1 Tax=Podila minutissima TaxID=64525 RepID=A0A9P5SIL9_9FUNG|nr:hypothetical protein BG006_008357 [Podila minutissima]